MSLGGGKSTSLNSAADAAVTAVCGGGGGGCMCVSVCATYVTRCIG